MKNIIKLNNIDLSHSSGSQELTAVVERRARGLSNGLFLIDIFL